MNTKFRALLLLLLVSAPMASVAMTNAPRYCPGIEAVKQLPYSKADVDWYLGWYAMTKTSNYDTQNSWTTVMFVGKSNADGGDMNPSDAIKFANTHLSQVQVAMNSIPEEENGKYWCFYADKRDNPGVVIFSISPEYESLSQGFRSFKQKHYFKR